MTSINRRHLLKGMGGTAAVAWSRPARRRRRHHRPPRQPPRLPRQPPPVPPRPRPRPRPSPPPAPRWLSPTGAPSPATTPTSSNNWSTASISPRRTSRSPSRTRTTTPPCQQADRRPQARNAPEVVLLSDVWWFKFYLNKTLQPLDDLMKAENINPATTSTSSTKRPSAPASRWCCRLPAARRSSTTTRTPGRRPACPTAARTPGTNSSPTSRPS